MVRSWRRQRCNLVDFALLYHHCPLQEILQHLENNFSFHQHNTRSQKPLDAGEKGHIKVTSLREIIAPELTKYLSERKIPLEIARAFCKEVDFVLYDKKRTAAGLKNNSGGYELRNAYFKGSASPKDVTFTNNNSENMRVFEGLFGFLSFQTLHQKHFYRSDKFTHRDTNHQHIHIVANRIGFDKRTVSDSNNYQKIAKYCRKMELKYELKQVLSPKKFLSKEQRNIPRFDQRKELLRSNIQQALKECYNLQEFKVAMNKRGYQIIKGRGISFADEKKVTVKGSELNYSLATIEKILDRQQFLQAHKQSNHVIEPLVKQPANSNHSIFQSNKEDIIDVLMKPQLKNEEIDKHFPQKRKKKKKSQHL